MLKNDKSKYIGEYKEGNRHGYGMQTTSGGDRGDAYIGEYSEDNSEGLGVFKFGALGEQYAGEWSQGVFNGMGFYKYADGSRYLG